MLGHMNVKEDGRVDLTVGGMRWTTLHNNTPQNSEPETTESRNNFTLRQLLLQKSRERDEKNQLKLPKLNVVEFSSEDNKNGGGPSGNGVQCTNTSNTALLNMNQRMNQMKAQKEFTSVQMYSQRMVRLRMTQNQRRQILPWFGSTVVVPQGLGFSYRVRSTTYHDGSTVLPLEQEFLSLGSSSTPTVPYSTADILYGSEVTGGGGSGRNQPTDDIRQNGYGELDRSKDVQRQKSKDLEQHPNNRRPNSKNGKQKSISIDSVTPFDKDREDPLKSLSAALPPTKPTHHFRPNGIKSSKGEQLFNSSKPNGAVSGRDQDDLVAMGTYWSPNAGGNPQGGQNVPPTSSSATMPSQSSQERSGARTGPGASNTNTNSYPSKVTSSGSINHSSSTNSLNTQRKYPSNSMRPIVVQNNISGKKNTNSREQEDPKYTDPMMGAPASFQQRLIELGALEGDTVRWERSKRLKKKKADRDS